MLQEKTLRALKVVRDNRLINANNQKTENPLYPSDNLSSESSSSVSETQLSADPGIRPYRPASFLDLPQERLVEGIILSEILGKPKSRRIFSR